MLAVFKELQGSKCDRGEGERVREKSSSQQKARSWYVLVGHFRNLNWISHENLQTVESGEWYSSYLVIYVFLMLRHLDLC